MSGKSSVEGVDKERPNVLSTPLTGGFGGGAGSHLQQSINNYITTTQEKFSYKSMDYIVDVLHKAEYIAVVDFIEGISLCKYLAGAHQVLWSMLGLW